MLAITRRVGETILIGSDICITFIRSRGAQIRLGIDAPLHIPVRRGELVVEIDNNADRLERIERQIIELQLLRQELLKRAA